RQHLEFCEPHVHAIEIGRDVAAEQQRDHAPGDAGVELRFREVLDSYRIGHYRADGFFRTRNATDATAVTPPVASHACSVARANNATINPPATHGTTRPPGMTNGCSAAPASSCRSRHTAMHVAR